MHDQVDAGMSSPRRNVGRDQQRHLAAAEPLKRALPGCLSNIPVQRLEQQHMPIEQVATSWENPGPCVRDASFKETESSSTSPSDAHVTAEMLSNQDYMYALRRHLYKQLAHIRL